MTERITGIIGAMPEEINTIIDLFSDREEKIIGDRVYHTGMINGCKAVLVFSHWGKVAAALTVTTLILEFKITELIFTGVAGAIDPSLSVGDIVIGKRLFQHDMDARPIIRQYEIPLLGVLSLDTGQQQINRAKEIISDLLERKHLERVIAKEELEHLNIREPKLHVGDIASGDKFFSGSGDKHTLQRSLPSVLCVEMEGAAVAQVCYAFKIPFTIIRTISDTADENAGSDFPSFIKNVSSKYSAEIVKLYFCQ
ncbi:MAG: 5'-methylthioadenosine/adenosylhomocysteine nucleosidase [Chitinophagales bacterium]|nr:5'-methylthioadenosine/adenosylhomocysteine nucleosidase [Chitinophagales bacterium]